MPKTIKLIGVLHDENLWRDYAEWILDNYREEKTVMLELYPPMQVIEYASPFFTGLESLLKRNHRKVIRGDTGLRLNVKEHVAIQRKFEEVDYAIECKKALPPHALSIIMSYIGTNIKEAAHNVYSGKRNEEFLKNTIEYEPDLVVLGSAHTDYLRRHLPSTHYVRFEDSRKSAIFRPKPDASIMIKDIEGYSFEKLREKGNHLNFIASLQQAR